MRTRRECLGEISPAGAWQDVCGISNCNSGFTTVPGRHLLLGQPRIQRCRMVNFHRCMFLCSCREIFSINEIIEVKTAFKSSLTMLLSAMFTAIRKKFATEIKVVLPRQENAAIPMECMTLNVWSRWFVTNHRLHTWGMSNLNTRRQNSIWCRAGTVGVGIIVEGHVSFFLPWTFREYVSKVLHRDKASNGAVNSWIFLLVYWEMALLTVSWVTSGSA